MIVYLRCSLQEDDPRLSKYIDANIVKTNQYKIICWNRLNKTRKENQHEIVFNRYSKFGGGVKNIFNKLRWQFFQLRSLLTIKKDIKTIHACDYDTIIPALILKFLYGKKVVFDVYDAFSEGFKTGSNVAKFARSFETFCANKSDLLIIADLRRTAQFYKLSCPIMVIENVPNPQYNPSKNPPTEQSNFPTLSYVGVLDHNRGIENTLEFVSKNSHLKLEIAGTGALEELVKKYSVNHSNINYHGQVQYSKGLDIMKNSDIIMAMYYKNVSNHIYAAPNKFYESLFLSVPIITTRGTLVGNKVEHYKTGFVIEENISDLEQLFGIINLESLTIAAQNCESCWSNNYKNYFKQTIVEDYLNRI